MYIKALTTHIHSRHLTCSWVITLVPWYTKQIVMHSFSISVLARRISRHLITSCRYIHRSHCLDYLRFELWRHAQIPSTTGGTCSLSACPQCNLSQMHIQFSFRPAEFPDTWLPAADTYIEAIVLIIWGLNFGGMHRYHQPLAVPAPSVHVHITICHRCTYSSRFGPPNFLTLDY